MSPELGGGHELSFFDVDFALGEEVFEAELRGRSELLGDELREAGVEVHERTVTWADVMEADEVFTTGNLSKVMPITRVENRDLQPGPLFRQARELYWEFAHKHG